jgi:hypothetical protein
MTIADDRLRAHLVELLDGGHAHLMFDQAVEKLSLEQVGQRPDNLPYSVWEQVEHLRRAQEDIVEFTRGPQWRSPPWPEGFWPDAAGPENADQWADACAGFRQGLEAMKQLVLDESRDLFEPFEWGDGQTLLRQAMMLGDHNAYHTAQIVAVRRAIDAWPA